MSKIWYGHFDSIPEDRRLLLAEDETEAEELVNHLQLQNTARQKAEQEILLLIEEQLANDPDLLHSRVLVIWGEQWHQGVIGIVASRLADKYARPSIVVSFEGDEGKGSGRSVAGFSLHGAIASCEDILIRYGGHDLAAGFSIEKQHIKAFRKRVNRWAAEKVGVMPAPKVWADAVFELSAFSVANVEDLSRLAPFGSGNAVPHFLVRGAAVETVYPVSEGKHSRLRLHQGGESLYAALFGTGPARLAYQAGSRVDVILALSLYEGKQGPQVSARVVELRPAGMNNDHVAQSALFESFLSGGAPGGEQSALLAPGRDDTADVYRAVRGGKGMNAGDLRPAFIRLGPQRTGRILVALAALKELGLIEEDGESGCYRAARVEGKKSLEESPILQKLAKAEQ
jgi:single-stranded-DNA-specific exonuclease